MFLLGIEPNSHTTNGATGSTLSDLVAKLESQLSKNNQVLNDLLAHKTAVAEAQTQADRALHMATENEQSVSTLTFEQQLQADKLERFRRQNDVVLRGIPLNG